MPVRRRPNGRWIIDFRIDGQRIRETLPASLDGLGKRDVAAMERQRRQEIEAQGLGPPDSWASIAARYWDEHGRHLAWQDSVSGHLNALSDLIGDHTPARAITTDLFARGVAAWRLSLAPATVNRRLAVARGLWGVARDLWGLRMPEIPWRRLRLPEPDREPPYIAPEVRDAIIACAPSHVALAMRIALATGWRKSSVLGLRWEHVDWQREIVHGRGKGRAGGKALVAPLTSELRAILEAAGVQGSGPVVAWQGKPVREIRSGFNTARAAADHPRVAFRDLRHSVAQEILALTGSLDLAGAALAHSNPAITRKHYARVQVDAVRAALEARFGHQNGHQQAKRPGKPRLERAERQTADLAHPKSPKCLPSPEPASRRTDHQHLRRSRRHSRSELASP
jgi:integrase